MWSEEYRLSLLGQLARKAREFLRDPEKMLFSYEMSLEAFQRIQDIALRSENWLENNKELIMSGEMPYSIKLEEPTFGN